MQPKLARYPRHPRKHTTHATYAGTPPTPPTLARYPCKHATQATHASTNSTLFLKLGTSLLYLQKYFIIQNSNYIFIIRKDWNICNLILKAALFFKFLFFQKILHFNIPLVFGSPSIPNLWSSFKYLQWYSCAKN